MENDDENGSAAFYASGKNGWFDSHFWLATNLAADWSNLPTQTFELNIHVNELHLDL